MLVLGSIVLLMLLLLLLALVLNCGGSPRPEYEDYYLGAGPNSNRRYLFQDEIIPVR